MSEPYNFESKKILINSIEYDSGLEYKWKVLWEQIGKRAIYHPVTFHTGKHWPNGEEIIYTPDFYLCDENAFCEVKPRDEMLRDPMFQQKISAAMDYNTTPIGHGLFILGDMKGFTPNKHQGAKKVFLWGEMYSWCVGSIEKGYWGLGSDSEDDEVHFFRCEEKDYDDFPHYPRFAKNPSAELGRSYDDPHASKILWKALGSAMYAVQNLEKNNDEKGA